MFRYATFERICRGPSFGGRPYDPATRDPDSLESQIIETRRSIDLRLVKENRKNTDRPMPQIYLDYCDSSILNGGASVFDDHGYDGRIAIIEIDLRHRTVGVLPI